MMGDKIQAKKIAKENGLPVIEGSDGGVQDVAAAKELCKKIGFPVLIKALIKTGKPIFLHNSFAAATS